MDQAQAAMSMVAPNFQRRMPSMLSKTLKISAITIVALAVIAVVAVALFYGHIPLLAALAGLAVWKSGLIMGAVCGVTLTIYALGVKYILKKIRAVLADRQPPHGSIPFTTSMEVAGNRGHLTKGRAKEQLAKDLRRRMNSHLWLGAEEIDLTLKTPDANNPTYSQAGEKQAAQTLAEELYQKIEAYISVNGDHSSEEIERRSCVVLSQLCQGAFSKLGDEMLQGAKEFCHIEELGVNNESQNIEVRLDDRGEVIVMCARVDSFRDPASGETIMRQTGMIRLSHLFEANYTIDNLEINGNSSQDSRL